MFQTILPSKGLATWSFDMWQFCTQVDNTELIILFQSFEWAGRIIYFEK